MSYIQHKNTASYLQITNANKTTYDRSIQKEQQDFFSRDSHNIQKNYTYKRSQETEAEEGLYYYSDQIEQVVIYGGIISVDMKCHQSINEFLDIVQTNKNISTMTKECIKIVILQKAIKFTPQIAPILRQEIKKYENIRLKSIFN